MSGPFYAPGIYVCRVTQQGFGEAKSSGNPMILIAVEPTHQVRNDPDGAEYLDAVGQSYERTLRLVIANDDQKEYAMLKLRHAGFVGDSFAQLNLVDSDVRCKCEHKEGTGDHAGKTFEQWDLLLPPRDRVALQPLDKGAARKLDALFGKRLKEGAKKPAAAAVASQSDDGEYAPF